MKKSEKVWKNLENLDFEKKIWTIQNKSEKIQIFRKILKNSGKNLKKWDFQKKSEKLRLSEKIWKIQKKIWEIQIFRKKIEKIENFRFSGWKNYLNLNLN
jgi:virulence-associated protein VapD